MLEIFNIKAIDSEVGEGELHLHEARDSCSSLFRNPNISSLKGIAPHVHQSCDDIEILLRGKIILPFSPKRGYSVAAPALILSCAGETHGFIADTAGASVVGVRCPKDYRGHSADRANTIAWNGRVFPIDQASLKEYRTPHCNIRVQTLSRGASCAVIPHPNAEYVGVLLCKGGLLRSSDGTSKLVDGDVLVFSSNSKLVEITMFQGGNLIEILPLENDGGGIV